MQADRHPPTFLQKIPYLSLIFHDKFLLQNDYFYIAFTLKVLNLRTFIQLDAHVVISTLTYDHPVLNLVLMQFSAHRFVFLYSLYICSRSLFHNGTGESYRSMSITHA